MKRDVKATMNSPGTHLLVFPMGPSSAAYSRSSLERDWPRAAVLPGLRNV